MSDARGIPRRTVLKGLGGSAALGWVAPGWVTALLGCGRESALAGSLAVFFSDPVGARAVGREYRLGYPAEDDAEALARAIAGEEFAAWDALASDAAGLAIAVRTRHRDDFAHGRVVRIHGWVLSQTEVRLCALADLAHEADG